MKILHTADIHLGAEAPLSPEACRLRKYEVLNCFKNITLLCISENVDICLIAGDLFDSNRVAAEFAAPVFEYITAVPNTEFFYVAGNHDPLDAVSPMRAGIPKNLHIFETAYQTVVLGEKKARITGRSFSHSSMEFEPMPPMPDDDYTNILLLHSDLGTTDSRYNPITKNFVENSGADYIALGHIHKRTEPEKIGNTYVAYCGCPEGQGFDELGEKGVYIGEISKNNCNLSFKPCCKRMYIAQKIDLSSISSVADAESLILQTLKQNFGDGFADNFYKILLVGTTEKGILRENELYTALSQKLYFVKIENRLKPLLDLEALSGEISLKGVFVKKMLERISNASEAERKKLTDALYIGLNAFDGEVAFDEN